MPAVEIVVQRPRHSVLKLVGAPGINQASEAIHEIADRLWDSLHGTVIVVAPPTWNRTLADSFLVRAIENMVAMEGGSFQLVH